MSLARLLFWTFVDLFVVLVLAAAGVIIHALILPPTFMFGVLHTAHAAGLSLPALGLQERFEESKVWRYTLEGDYVKVPADDQAVLDWLRKQGAYRPERVTRTPPPPNSLQKETVRVRIDYLGPADQPRPDVPWKELGYEPGEPTPNLWWFKVTMEGTFRPNTAQMRLYVVGCLQGGMLIVGMVHVWRRRNLAPAAPAATQGNALLIGLGLGLGLGALYWIVDQLLLQFTAPTISLERPWLSIPSADLDSREAMPVWMRSVSPHPALIGTTAAMLFLHPLAQTVFMWGALARWEENGRPLTGALIGGVLAAATVLSWTVAPLAFLVALLLFGFSARTQNLGVPLLALVALDGVILAVSFGAIPALSHPVNMLPGVWEPKPMSVNVFGIHLPVKQEIPKLRLLRGGAINTRKILQVTPGLEEFQLAHFEWIDSANVRLSGYRYLHDVAKKEIFVKEEVHAYGISVDWQTLKLTDSKGGVMELRRDIYFP